MTTTTLWTLNLHQLALISLDSSMTCSCKQNTTSEFISFTCILGHLVNINQIFNPLVVALVVAMICFIFHKVGS